ncbi:MAG: hypothetical protein N2V73_04470 [Candidatus Methanospirare jalkutatii]|nr:hypothetical protein [Candidatus Methanospirare jalkutatii]
MKKSLDKIKEIKARKRAGKLSQRFAWVKVDLVEKFALKPRISKRILSEVAYL